MSEMIIAGVSKAFCKETSKIEIDVILKDFEGNYKYVPLEKYLCL